MSTARDTLSVHTADNVELGFPVAGLGSRGLALVLDLLILVVLETVVVLGVATLATAISPGRMGDALATLLVSGLIYLVMVAYFTLTEVGTGGRTPGKVALGLRVINGDGGGLTVQGALVRNLVLFLDLVLGPVVMFIDGRSRRLGDLFGGTLVVRESTGADRGPLGGVPMPSPVFLRTPDAGPPIDGLGHLGRHEYNVLRSFLGRYDIHPMQRHRLAADMALRLFERMQLSPVAPERHWPPELFLERLYLQLDERFSRP